ncbi:hypothetical protein CYY_002514 [Polysphondylium violaceum]|uniref:WD40 repeat-containing protein n=1 Tax=Polysphondylium violaceum TaxID=133409 RepID=A0A8J4PYA4_9MYCE|nr:hypothetical protein CYY_002514 [Polysphondylium violaceum]
MNTSINNSSRNSNSSNSSNNSNSGAPTTQTPNTATPNTATPTTATLTVPANNNNNNINNNSNNLRSPFLSLFRLASPNFQELLSSSLLENSALQGNTEFNDLITHTLFSNLPLSPPVQQGVLGDATFFDSHSRVVRGVDFSPNDDHIFCSAGLDGKCNIYDARFGKLKSSSTISFQGTVNFSGIKFLTGVNKIALTTSSNKLLIFDIEKAAVFQSFDRCCFSGPSRTSIALDPSNPNCIMVPNISGKGLSQIDLRSPASAIKSFNHIHQNSINDIEILDSSWSNYYGRGRGNLIMTVGSDSNVLTIDSQSNLVQHFQLRSQLFSIAHTPEPPNQTTSCLAIGGDRLNILSIDGGTSDQQHLSMPNGKSITRLRYTKNGTKLFVASNDGNLRLYSRTKRKHEPLGVVFKHSRDIIDCSISRNDEYIVTASSDSRVGLIRIGDPIYGPSEVGDIMY